MDEQRLIARILDGHESDYGYFLERYGGEVFAIVSRLVPNREDAEELTQDAFGSVIWQALVNTSKQPNALSLALPTLFCLTFFALLNHLLARHYISKDRTAPQ